MTWKKKLAGRRISSAHVLAVIAIVMACASGAYAQISVPRNSVGSPQLKNDAVREADLGPDSVTQASMSPNAVNGLGLASSSVGSAELRDRSVGTAELKELAVGAEQMKAGAVGETQMRAGAVGETQMQANSVGASQLQALAVGLGAIQANVVGALQLQTGAVQTGTIASGAVSPDKLSPSATTTLYTHTSADQTVTTDTTLGSLSLPAGSYLLSASVNAAVTGIGPSTTRLECWLTNGPTLFDYAKIRLQPNSSDENLLFAKAPLEGAASFGSPTSVSLHCTSSNGVGGGAIELTYIHLNALRVAQLITQ